MKENDINNILDQLVQTSLGLYQANHDSLEENWQLAIALENQGWKIIRNEPSTNRNQAVILVFEKDGVEKTVSLGYSDQQKWFDFISKRG